MGWVVLCELDWVDIKWCLSKWCCHTQYGRLIDCMYVGQTIIFCACANGKSLHMTVFDENHVPVGIEANAGETWGSRIACLQSHDSDKKLRSIIMHTSIRLAPRRCVKENYPTSPIVAFIKKHLCRRLFKHLLPDSISERSKRDCFCLCGFPLAFFPSAMRADFKSKQSSDFSSKSTQMGIFHAWCRGWMCLRGLSLTRSCFR